MADRPVLARGIECLKNDQDAVRVLSRESRLVLGEQLPLADFRLHAPTLDDVFLAKTGRKLEGGEPAAEPEPVPA